MASASSNSKCSDAVRVMWDDLAKTAYLRWDKTNYIATLPKMSLPKPANPADDCLTGLPLFDGPGPWDRTNVEVELDKEGHGENEKLTIFSSNDYLGLSSHPAVREAAIKATKEYGMGPRASSMICGHSNYHRQLENTLADLTGKEACVITPTGFAANTAFMAALGSIATLLASGKKPSKSEKIAIFSDALNHASIIDGLRYVERMREADVYVYKHNDMTHLAHLLSNCPNERKVVITDSIFSMEGDFCPMMELIEMRKKYGFLLVVDEAHTTLVCGRTGRGIGELYGVEDQIDICIGTISKGTGCIGGFVCGSKYWKLLVQSRGRPYIFTTSLPVPIVVGALAAIEVAKKEEWRRKLVWSYVDYFSKITKFNATTPILSLVIGTEEETLRASRQLFQSGFHVTAIRPPAVPANACRLRITLTAAHTKEDVDTLIVALSKVIKFPIDEEQNDHTITSRL